MQIDYVRSKVCLHCKGIRHDIYTAEHSGERCVWVNGPRGMVFGFEWLQAQNTPFPAI